ncbi:HNH endonuclease signature motif containing protein [Planktothrix mougeotii]|uniref:HNH endonuclease n=1 Tax=Planktothrix mougeotii LEGE 06226 TaxID=1828728 RepID=A0ABR9U915_9CYAN|nr:HNH endonuclease signature motif containing protein [Planktothrix mougeotii]MBE9142094.1 HNH endonuclease [Planktothrix mougeotii LEGE 06226]
MDAKHPDLPYTVSEDGSMLKVRGQGIKKTTRSTAGYRQISCYGKTFLVHRVVWEAFNGEIPQGLQINHIDGNKANNSLSNLELVTPAENIRHAVKTGLKQGQSCRN